MSRRVHEQNKNERQKKKKKKWTSPAHGYGAKRIQRTVDISKTN